MGCGGHNGQNELSSAERFDPVAQDWEALPPLSQRRSGAAVAVVAGLLYVCGGYDGSEVLSSMERFDPGTGAWEALALMSERRDHAAAAVFSGGIAGGLRPECPFYLRCETEFRPKEGF